MEQGCGQFALHAFAEGKFAHLFVEKGLQVEKITELGKTVAKFVGGNIVDGLIDNKTFHRRQIPVELVFLAHNQGDLLKEERFSLLGRKIEDANPTVRGVQESGKNLQSGGLARAVWP